MSTIEDSKIDQQLALEEESVTEGQRKYYSRLNQQQENEQEYNTRPVRALINRSVDIVAQFLEADMGGAKGRGRPKVAHGLIRGVPYEVLAFLTLRSAYASVKREQEFTRVATRLGTAVLEEINFNRFKEQEAETYKTTQRHIQTHANTQKKRKVMRRMFRLSDIDPIKWSREDTARVGAYLLDAYLQCFPDMFISKLVKRRNGKGKVRMLEPTLSLMAFLKDAHDQISLMSPVRMPMVVPPRPWTGVFEGGYLTDLGGRLSMLKSINESYLEALDQVDMPEVYAGINTIQATPWRINVKVLEVAKQLWHDGVSVGPEGKESLPCRDPRPIPALPAGWEGRPHELKRHDFEMYKQWAKLAAPVHESNHKLFSKRMATIDKLNMAERFKDEEAIYFPCVMDFRGRVYPVPQYLNPQGNDLSKALLLFAEGKPITERGYYWLCVHVANCFGVDKVSNRERFEWTQAHMDRLLDSGLDPLHGGGFWGEADDPFMALAACFELVGYSFEGADYVSHLPIPMDGSCNGLQNFSALLRDPIGGKATNLVPQENPADIYTEVAEVVAAQVREDALAGVKEALYWDGYVSRKIVKQPVMTLPYGATKSGMRKQIENAARKNGLTHIPTSDMWKACGYLANTTHECIGRVVVAARDAMDWLQAVARVAASGEYPVRWTTPLGLPVLQEYKQLKAQKVNIHLDGVKREIYVNVDGKMLDKRRQSAGISPNLIHSFDSSHMLKTTVLAHANGVSSFAMIHDSFGTHAADTDILHAAIRESFIEMYQGNLLARFRDEMAEQLPDEVAEELPPLPEMGTLDLEVVRDSLYFFA